MNKLLLPLLALTTLLSTRSAVQAYAAQGHYCRLDSHQPGDISSLRHYAPSREIDVLHLKLEVTPNFDERTVSGTVRINFSPIAMPLEELSLDAVDLHIESVKASSSIAEYQNTDEKLIITFKKAIPAGKESYVEVEQGGKVVKIPLDLARRVHVVK